MKSIPGLDQNETILENAVGLISGYFLFVLWEVSTAAGASWKFDDPSTMEIIVTKQNADQVYAMCKEIRSGYSIGLRRTGMKKIKEARSKAHQFLYDEANDPETPIQRKIDLVRLCSR